MSDPDQNAATTSPDNAPEAEKTSSVSVPKWALFSAGGVVVALIVIGGGLFIANQVAEANERQEAAEIAAAAEAEAAERRENLFKDAVAACRDEAKTSYNDVVVRDGGESMSIDGAGRSDFSNMLDWEHTECILQAVDAPGSVLDRMGSTRALDGTQEAGWDDLAAHWTYHPDSGIDVVLEFE